MRRVSWLVMVVASMALVALPVGGSAEDQTAPARGRGAQSAAAGPVVVFETVKGNVEIEMYPNEAPRTVEHILALVRRNFYNGLRIHRVERGFVVQFGDPQTRDASGPSRARWGSRGSGRPVGVAEIKRPHRLGSVAMAHAGDPARADAQMYITMSPQPQLDSRYTVFGQVIAGMDVVNRLAIGDVIRRATVKQ